MVLPLIGHFYLCIHLDGHPVPLVTFFTWMMRVFPIKNSEEMLSHDLFWGIDSSKMGLESMTVFFFFFLRVGHMNPRTKGYYFLYNTTTTYSSLDIKSWLVKKHRKHTKK